MTTAGWGERSGATSEVPPLGLGSELPGYAMRYCRGLVGDRASTRQTCSTSRSRHFRRGRFVAFACRWPRPLATPDREIVANHEATYGYATLSSVAAPNAWPVSSRLWFPNRRPASTANASSAATARTTTRRGTPRLPLRLTISTPSGLGPAETV